MSNLFDLADRIEKAGGPDRELDADIAEHVYGWRLARVGADYYGDHISEILTENGRLPEGYSYPPVGKIPRYWHVPSYTRDCLEPTFPKDAVRKELAAALRAKAEMEKDNG